MLQWQHRYLFNLCWTLDLWKPYLFLFRCSNFRFYFSVLSVSLSSCRIVVHTSALVHLLHRSPEYTCLLSLAQKTGYASLTLGYQLKGVC